MVESDMFKEEPANIYYGYGWSRRYTEILGKFVSPIIMGIVYFTVVFPTFLFIKLFKKNYLNLKYDNSKETYWITNQTNKQNSMKDQF